MDACMDAWIDLRQLNVATTTTTKVVFPIMVAKRATIIAHKGVLAVDAQQRAVGPAIAQQHVEEAGGGAYEPKNTSETLNEAGLHGGREGLASRLLPLITVLTVMLAVRQLDV